MKNYNGEVIRVLEFTKDEAKNYHDNFIIGKPFSESQYLSSSFKKGYNDDANIVINIISKTGKNISVFNEKEAEVLFMRNTIFVVIDMFEKDGKYYVRLREI